jgi:hypothetical protein
MADTAASTHGRRRTSMIAGAQDAEVRDEMTAELMGAVSRLVRS